MRRRKTEVVIRYPKKGDLEGVLQIARDRRREVALAKGKVGRLSRKMKSWWPPQLVTGRRARRITLLAEIDNKIVGVIVVVKSRGWRLSYAPWWVCVIGVIRGSRRRGVGRELLRTALSEVKKTLEARKIGLKVAEANPASGLYLACGFRRAGIADEKMKWGGRLVNGIVMTRVL